MSDLGEPSAGSTGPKAAPPERTSLERSIPRSCSDVYRLWAAVGLGLVLTMLFYVAQEVAHDLGFERNLTPAELALEEDFGANLVGWVGFAIAYLWLGIRAFSRADHAELVRRIEGSPLPASTWRRWLLAGGGSLGWPVAISVWAFSAVITATLNRQDTPGLVIVFAALTVFSCAAVITFSFALHYARKDVTEGGLEFLGSDLPVFSDYVYVAVGGTVAFGPQDVMVVSSSMRRTVSVQTILGWLLSTVIIAVLLSLVTS